MKDFTKWMEAWNTYIHPPTKQVPRTAAELSAGGHSAWVIIAMPLEEYFERIRQAYGIELVGIIELGDMWIETDGKEGHGRQSRDGEDDYDAG